MKISAPITVLATVLALVGGTAVAAPSSGNADTARAQPTAQAEAPKSDGIVEKTKRAFHKLGDKMRDAGRRVANKVDKDKPAGNTQSSSKNDTRSMGANGSATSDTARRERMDEAYSNSRKSRQQ